MVNGLICTFLEHPKRKYMVVASTIVFSLLTVVPAWDHYCQAREESGELDTELREISYSLANLELLKEKLTEYSNDARPEDRMLGRESAERVRERVTVLTHQLDCQVRRLTLSDPVVRPWRTHDDPFSQDASEHGEDTDYLLETRTLTLSIDGNLQQLTRMVGELSNLDRFAAPSSMALQREGIDGHLVLDVEIYLFNLEEIYD